MRIMNYLLATYWLALGVLGALEYYEFDKVDFFIASFTIPLFFVSNALNCNN